MSTAQGEGARETFNPWTVVNLVFHHLAENGLHPVLGETGDPAVPATAFKELDLACAPPERIFVTSGTPSSRSSVLSRSNIRKNASSFGASA